MKTTEQLSKIEASNTAFSNILEMINSGKSINEIKNHCIIMIDALEKQRNITKKKNLIIQDAVIIK